MGDLNFFEVMYDNNLLSSIGPFSPNTVQYGVEDPSRITGIRFVFINNQGHINKGTEDQALEMGADLETAQLVARQGETFTSKFYFIGDVVNYDDIKHLFVNTSSEDEIYEKYAVSYDENGKIFDVRPLISQTEEVIPVKNAEELEQAYFEITGENLSITSSMKK